MTTERPETFKMVQTRNIQNEASAIRPSLNDSLFAVLLPINFRMGR